MPGGIDIPPLPGRYLTAPSTASVASVRLAGTTTALCAAPDWDQLHEGCYSAALFGAPRTTALTLALALTLTLALALTLTLALTLGPNLTPNPTLTRRPPHHGRHALQHSHLRRPHGSGQGHVA